MDIVLNCPACGQRLAVDEAGAGLEVSCPTCGAPLVVPEAGDAGSASVAIGIASATSPAQPATLESPRAGPSMFFEVSPFQWILRGTMDGLRGAPILFLGLLCALIIYALAAAVLCIGDFFVFGPLLCGVWAMALGILRRQPGALGRMFDGFGTFWRAVGLGLLCMLTGGVAGLLAWVLFLLSALVLPGAWPVSAFLAALASSYPSWRLGFAAPLLVDRKLEVGECLAGSCRMTAGLPMHLAWLIFVFFGIGLAVILGGLFVVATGLFGVGVVEAMKASQQPSQVFAAFGSAVVVVALLAPLVAGLWVAVILMTLAQAYTGTLGRLGGTEAVTQAEEPKGMPRVVETAPSTHSQCPQCNQLLEAGARFCTRCGVRVGDSKSVGSQPALIATVAGGVVLLVALAVIGVKLGETSLPKSTAQAPLSPNDQTARRLGHQPPGFRTQGTEPGPTQEPIPPADSTLPDQAGSTAALEAGIRMIEGQPSPLTARELAGNWETDRLMSLELKASGDDIREGSFVPAEDKRYSGRIGRLIFQGQRASFAWGYLSVSGSGSLERQSDGRYRVRMVCSKAPAASPRVNYGPPPALRSGRRPVTTAIPKRDGTGSPGLTGNPSASYQQTRQRETARRLFADGRWCWLRPSESHPEKTLPAEKYSAQRETTPNH